MLLTSLTPFLPSLMLLLGGCTARDETETGGVADDTETTVAPAPEVVQAPGQDGGAQDGGARDGEAAFDQSHALLTEVLARYVKGSAVDYKALKKDRGKLDTYVASLGKVDQEELAKWSREQRYAFWINVYNAHVLTLIIDNYPVDSIKDIGSLLSPVWNKEFIRMRGLHPGGKDDDLSLDDVEHKILRPRFKDARVHAAVNCASVSCPPLRAEAFVAERLGEQLDSQVRTWLADPTRNRFDEKSRTLYLSQIFDWFEADFRRDAGGVQAWVARYTPPAAVWVASAKAPKVRYLDYSWDLNDTPREGR